MITAPIAPVNIFYAYAREDELYRKELEKHLSSLRRQCLIKEWHDRQIRAGTEWEHAINKHLDMASIILLLISPDFLASDYCYDVEMKRAMERHQAKKACVIPIILRPVDWVGTPFAKLQMLPTDAKPIATWPSQDEAFLDITRGIREVIEELHTSALSMQIELQIPWNIPYRRNPFFTGQEAILSQLHDRLSAEKVTALTQPQALHGLGGIGKTQIALEYAYRYRDTYHAVLWIHAESRESLVSSFLTLAQVLHLPEKNAQDQTETIKAVKHWLDTQNRWLLIFDNADTLSVVDDFFPTENRGHILLTTRMQALGPIAQSIEVEQMGIDDGPLLLLRRAKVLAPNVPLEQATPADRRAAEMIVQELGGLPLALDQAGAYIDETGCSVSGYLERYLTYRARLLSKRGKMITNHPESLLTTLSLTFEKVARKNPAAIELLHFCALLYPDAIPEELLIEGFPHLGPQLQDLANDLIAFDEIMEVLRAYSLVHRDASTKTISFHRLVQAVLLEEMNEDVQRLWAERAVHVVNHGFPNPEDVGVWSLCQRFLLQAQTCAIHINRWNIQFAEASLLLNQVGYYLEKRAFYKEAESFYRQALVIREQTYGRNHPDVALILDNLGTLYEDLGKYTDAVSLLQHALSIRQQAFGPDHYSVGISLNNLAFAYWKQGKYTEAEPLYRQALSIRERIHGPVHANVALSLNNLGTLYWKQKRYEAAEPLYLRTRSILEQVFGPIHPHVAGNLHNLAALYSAQGKYEEAEPLYLRARSILEQMFGPIHPEVAFSLNSLAELYSIQGNYVQAEPLYKHALFIREQTLGLNHADTAFSLHGLAKAYDAQGNYAQAELLYKQVLSVRMHVLEPTHPDVVAVLENYAALLQKEQRDDEASEIKAYIGALQK